PLASVSDVSLAEQTATKQAPPNIVLIVADDLGYNDISLHGNALVRTPHIDSIGRDGVRFLNGYSAHATCSPSRAAMMTGRFPSRFGYEYVALPPVFKQAFDGTYPTEDVAVFREDIPPPSEDDPGLPTDEITVAELLKAKGYRTALVGKWHLGGTPKTVPTARGFDEFVGILGGGGMFSPKDDDWSVDARLTWSGIDNFLWDRLPFVMIDDGKPVTPPGYITDVFGDRAVKFVRESADKPFFLFLSFTAPHNPLDAPRDIYDRLTHIKDHTQRVYVAMIESMDAAIGRVLDTLNETGAADNTLVIFTSDNGGAWYTNIPWHNLPYRGWKSGYFEGGIHVPLFARWPGKIQPGSIVSDAVSGIDMMPTLAAVAGANPPDDRIIDGVNLVPSMTEGTSIPERSLYWAAGGYRALRRGDWKLHDQKDPDHQRLFNLALDPTEQVDLLDVEPEQLKTLSAEMNRLVEQMRPPPPRQYRLKQRVGPYIGKPKASEQDWIWVN
ncbi:MAG: sulfatase, partial [Pseudomonadota bacterium]